VDRSATDAINAELVRAAEGRTPRDLLEELDSSWEALREVVASLTDDDLTLADGWIVSKVAGNSWPHYEEHLPELP
jgi:hypothetical protein